MSSLSYVIPSLGTEKSQHLWELIKAKLASLNLYTDDVLSEYIMVLLQGGNGKEKIYEELVIFMNSPEVAEHFVLWLFGEIEKLLAVTVSAPVNAQVNLSAPVSVSVSEPMNMPTHNVNSHESTQDDVQMGSGNRVHSTRSFSRALESVKSNIHNPTRRTFSTEPTNYTDLNESDPREIARNNRESNRRSPQRSSNRRVVRNISEEGGKVQKIKLSVDFDREEQQRSRPSSNRKPFKKIQVNNNNEDNDNDNVSNKTDTSAAPVIRVKCQYWPNCRAGDSCPNVHPSETCKHFPNCQFGDSCTFLHPSIPCKFQEKCQNPLCNYQHRPMAMMNMMGMTGGASSINSSGTSTILCKFYPRCVNVNCPYLHPVKVQCRYGVDCSRPDCPFEHPSGRKGAHLKSVVFAPCKYGKQCARADCPYQHTEEIVTVSGSGAVLSEEGINPTENQSTSMMQ